MAELLELWVSVGVWGCPAKAAVRVGVHFVKPTLLRGVDSEEVVVDGDGLAMK